MTTREPEKLLPVMIIAMGECLSDLACSDDGEDGDNEDDNEREQGKRSKDDKPGRVLGTISTTVQQHMKRFPQTQMKLQKVTKPGCGHTGDCSCEGDRKIGPSEWFVPAFFELQMDNDAATSTPTTFSRHK